MSQVDIQSPVDVPRLHVPEALQPHLDILLNVFQEVFNSSIGIDKGSRVLLHELTQQGAVDGLRGTHLHKANLVMREGGFGGRREGGMGEMGRIDGEEGGMEGWVREGGVREGEGGVREGEGGRVGGRRESWREGRKQGRREKLNQLV